MKIKILLCGISFFSFFAGAQSLSLEGRFELPQGYRYRLIWERGLAAGSLSILGEDGEVEGYNYTFRAGPFYSGSITPSGLMKEVLIPSISRYPELTGGMGINLDCSYAGSSRRGIGLSFLGGRLGGFFMKGGEERYESGLWYRSGNKLFSPGIAAVFSNPGDSEKNSDIWIRDESPFLSEITGSALLFLPFTLESLTVILLGGLSFSTYDSPGGWFCSSASCKTRYIHLTGRAGGASSYFRKPSGGRMGEVFSWEVKAELFPRNILGAAFLMGESQGQLKLQPAGYRAFSSQISGDIFFRPEPVLFEVGGALKHKGESSGMIRRERSWYGEITIDRGSLFLKNAVEYELRDGEGEKREMFKGEVRAGLNLTDTDFSAVFSLILEEDSWRLEGHGGVELEQENGSVNIELKPVWSFGRTLCFRSISKAKAVFTVSLGFKYFPEINH